MSRLEGLEFTGMSGHNAAKGRKSKTRVSICTWGHRFSREGSDGSFACGVTGLVRNCVGSHSKFCGRKDVRAVLNAAGSQESCRGSVFSHRYLDKGHALSCT